MEKYQLFYPGAKLFLLLVFCIVQFDCSDLSSKDLNEGETSPNNVQTLKVIPGADQPGLYVPILRGKNVGLVVNHSSMVGDRHLLDTLLALDIQVKKIFSPEHGFRGDVADGAVIKDGKDPRTGLPVVSLYGRNKKPTVDQLADLDILVFDIQDVGVRFYTYLSTLHYVMESAAEQGKMVLVLDRPNPNGYYIDGPVLEPAHSSFIGLHPVPIVYGMTIGEYALMINGQSWLAGGIQCVLKVIPLINYVRSNAYALPVRPSPNLPTPASVLLYPSLALFEGTTVSVGRGTDQPFQCFGHPSYTKGLFSFIPRSIKSSTSPPWEGQACFGADLSGLSFQEVAEWKKLNLSFLMEMYHSISSEESFFREDGYFEKLAGTRNVRVALENGISEIEMRESWKPELEKFGNIRAAYLLYPDFH